MKPSGKKENATEKLIIFSSEVYGHSFAEFTAMIQSARPKACHQSILSLSTYTGRLEKSSAPKLPPMAG